MGTKLLPAPRQKSHIETLVELGVITGPILTKWNERVKETKRKEALLKKAQEGGVEAMEDVGLCFLSGQLGFKKNDSQAYHWFEKAHQSGSVVGTALSGALLLYGNGVEADLGLGMMRLGSAEAKGSDYAAYTLGYSLAKGVCGLKQNKPEGRRLLEKSLSGSCQVRHLSDTPKVTARELLTKLEESL